MKFSIILGKKYVKDEVIKMVEVLVVLFLYCRLVVCSWVVGEFFNEIIFVLCCFIN